MVKGPKDLPQNELPEMKDEIPISFSNRKAENLAVENKDNLLYFIQQIVADKETDKVVSKAEKLKLKEKIDQLDCTQKKAILLYISKRILTKIDKERLIEEHAILRDKVDKSEELESAIKNLDEEEVTSVLGFLIKSVRFKKILASKRVTDFINEI